MPPPGRPGPGRGDVGRADGAGWSDSGRGEPAGRGSLSGTPGRHGPPGPRPAARPWTPGGRHARPAGRPTDAFPSHLQGPALPLDRRPIGRPLRSFEGPQQRPPTRGSARPSGAAIVMADDEELIAGRHPVEEAFVAGRTARRLLVTPQRRDALDRLVLHATALRIPVVEVEGGTLTATAGFDGHQGVALVVEARRFAAPDEILAHAIGREAAPLILALDSLEDPQNLGSLLRSAEAAGVDGVLFPTRRQAPLSPAAVKASAGASEHLLLAPVGDLAVALAGLHLRGLRIVGADADAALTYREVDLRGPLVLVVGSEGRGLAPPIRRRCDQLIRIPMRGRIASLNAAVAGSILVFEAAMQRGESGPAPDPGRGAPAAGRDTVDPPAGLSAEPPGGDDGLPG